MNLKKINKNYLFKAFIFFVILCSISIKLFIPKQKNKLIRIPLCGKFSRKYFSKNKSFCGCLINGSFSRTIKLPEYVSGNIVINFGYKFMNTNSNHQIKLTQLRNNIPIRNWSFKNKQKFIVKMSLTYKKNDKIRIIINNKGKLLISSLIISKQQKQPVYIFIIAADTLRRDFVGVYNHNSKATPNIDNFAKDSIVFENAYSTSSWTLPAFSSLFSSQYPFEHGVNNRKTKLNKEKNLTKYIFNTNKTIFITGDAFVGSRYNFSEWTDFFIEFPGDGTTQFSSKRLFYTAKKFINATCTTNTFFFLHTYQIHNKYYPESVLAREYYNKFDDKTTGFISFSPMEYIKKGKWLCRPTKKELLEKIKRTYGAGVYTFDYYFGKFIKFLKKRNLYKNSMIIFLSDHGEELYDHGCWEHGHSLYNELIKIPLIIKLPNNLKKGKRVYTIVSLIDIIPTICTFFKIHFGKQYVRGLNVFGRKIKKRKKIYFYLNPSLRKHLPSRIGIILHDKKYIYTNITLKKDLNFFTYPPQLSKYEVFSIKDNKEQKNIYSLKYKEIFIELEKLLKSDNKKNKSIMHKLDKETTKNLKSLGYL